MNETSEHGGNERANFYESPRGESGGGAQDAPPQENHERAGSGGPGVAPA
jgi:hypothetical protein